MCLLIITINVMLVKVCTVNWVKCKEGLGNYKLNNTVMLVKVCTMKWVKCKEGLGNYRLYNCMVLLLNLEK